MNLLRAVHATETRIAAENLPNLDARVNDWRERVQSGLGSVVSVVSRSVSGRTRMQGDSSGVSDKSSASPARRTTRTRGRTRPRSASARRTQLLGSTAT